MENNEKKEKKEKRNPETAVPSFTTFPIANAHTIDIDSRVTIPSEEDLEEGRDWVNENQK
ncbi:MAG: CDIF630_02480 family spore surface protein [Anaerovoracaceae bacterium]|jgi:hypothetical protein